MSRGQRAGEFGLLTNSMNKPAQGREGTAAFTTYGSSRKQNNSSVTTRSRLSYLKAREHLQLGSRQHNTRARTCFLVVLTYSPSKGRRDAKQESQLVT